MTDDTDVWGTTDVSSGKGASDENFPVGSLLISRALRPHVHAYYAYARVIDDIADSETLAPQDKVARLNAMEEVLHGQRSAINRPDARVPRACASLSCRPACRLKPQPTC